MNTVNFFVGSSSTKHPNEGQYLKFDKTNESRLHLGGPMTLAALERALTFLLAFRQLQLGGNDNAQ